MKRIALVAALAAIAAPAFAQSTVQVYGRLNTSVERQKAGDTSKTVMQNNSSRLGFKGSEDLGGGLKANFQLEHGFGADTGAASGDMWGRESWVGLSGNFGSVRLGNMTSGAYYALADYVSLHNHDTGTSADKLYGDDAIEKNHKKANKISYTTPSLSGFTAEVQYALKETGDDSTIDLAANYDMGPLHLGAGFIKTGDDKLFGIRALYELGAFTFGGYYERDKLDDDKRNNFRLSGMYTMGASEFHVNFGVAGDLGDADDTGAKQFTLGYNYNLSKRTKLYAFYTKLNNDKNGLYSAGGDNGNVAPADFSSFAVGIRHNF
ncbi:porin [Eleftheria terrae]|uniref:porin n=1 Tax=Eleftheria terrae TaxID=1597781 RepID=UPI00263BCCF9|nr:porin [Eleftheria terrae]WKB51458.1 porin [Eleftheria terrae]